MAFPVLRAFLKVSRVISGNEIEPRDEEFILIAHIILPRRYQSDLSCRATEIYSEVAGHRWHTFFQKEESVHCQNLLQECRFPRKHSS
ncbi:hypothetical protein MPTK1_3g25150 [Marchantia polymorpha subsp. ruderalis]|uniref:Uncharacterized protein n=2 Tax=Marchantia polymorpha TaxID=3197 RepID=A0AAF6B4K4_MARPO|nr:hypothetical protein MARPO_0100s0028 [Marchantia polymorpha]BBN06937.1 hypothetical protein Mp_3g25150 [Marchantia polymorpha subsp. ruderalis]PTQ32316.1 hypothetical protein MARPO_0100s0028 [Marchantia polymorpha]PTQ32317.1 hypothetical protein MARPO_0100s0028 [Marchantia polymorpha]BBN06938.1 hypothetical protein Mp_3g25150 [Marchantia polymorpha subsp. ruderalis]|eukprot:PTQ32315.1 hypothetical protein MARPO_0100s0028 [Marchantia polymorpha]